MVSGKFVCIYGDESLRLIHLFPSIQMYVIKTNPGFHGAFH